MVTTAIVSWPNAVVQAQERAASSSVSFAIPAQSLAGALSAFGSATGIQVIYDASLAVAKRSPGVAGNLTPERALAALVSGTGLSAHLTGARTATLVDPNAQSAAGGVAVDGNAIQLETIDVTTSGSQGFSADQIYETPGAVDYISSEQIEQFRGTSPADILKGVPGVMSGESRGNGGVDVNIRGLQGQGRVAVTVDGAANGMTVYRGYQGISNRSYIDPDFIGGVDVSKGPSAGPGIAGAIGGSVAMRTVNADDIVPEGEDYGVRMKVEGGTNTSPVSSRGYDSNNLYVGSSSNPYGGTNRDTDRPSVLEPTNGSASVLLATKSENVDLVAGFARRRSGNYHAGENGSGAPKRVNCDATVSTNCGQFAEWYRRGLTPYLAGEEVLNTSQDTYSALAKGTFRFAEDHKIELGYSHYDSKYGETSPWAFVQDFSRTYENTPSSITLNSYTSRYEWNPLNDLIELKANAWFTSLDDTSVTDTPARNFAEKWAQMWGGDIANTSRFSGSFGDLALTYGANYLSEETAPHDTAHTVSPAPRDAERQEVAVFANSRWKPLDWLQLDAGIRWHEGDLLNRSASSDGVTKTFDAWDYSAGVTVEPMDGVQLFVSYADAARLPSIFEGGSSFGQAISPDLVPERSKNWEIGANVKAQGLLREDDKLGVKLSYFDNTIDDYIYRKSELVQIVPGLPYYRTDLTIENLDKAHFSGLELSARYEIGSFTADLSANYYTDVEFCRPGEDCVNSSLAADYSTNYIPPEYSATLMLSKKFLDDALTLSARASVYGPRAADAETTTASGANPFIQGIPWRPFTLVDLYASYQVNDALKLNASVENLTDHYYVDPLSLVIMPSPGRTIRFGATAQLSSGQPIGALFSEGAESDSSFDWTGPYIGAHVGWADAYLDANDRQVFVTGTAAPVGSQHHIGSADGPLGGIHGGYDIQLRNNWVVGFEGDFSWMNGKSEQASIVNIPTTPIGENSPSYDPTVQMFETRYNWLASVRGRVGMTFGRVMAYGTAGVALAGAETTYTWFTVPFKDDSHLSGWTAGGGLEFALDDKWTVRGEYSFYKLSGQREATGVHPTWGDHTARWEANDGLNVFRLGLSYRF